VPTGKTLHPGKRTVGIEDLQVRQQQHPPLEGERMLRRIRMHGRGLRNLFRSFATVDVAAGFEAKDQVPFLRATP